MRQVRTVSPANTEADKTGWGSYTRLNDNTRRYAEVVAAFRVIPTPPELRESRTLPSAQDISVRETAHFRLTWRFGMRR